MKGIIKKTLSIILCFTMVFTMLQGTMLSASAKVVGPDNKTELTITTDKSKYSWGDTIVFTINVKNVTNETLKGIRINSFARNYMKVSQQGDLPVISRLEPGETKTVQIEYYATKMVGFMAIFFPVIWIFNPLARIAYKEANFNYEYKVKVGATKYRIGFEVEYNVDGESDENESIEFLEFSADVCDIKVNECIDVTFSANIKTNEKIDKLELCADGDSFVSYMYDDGTNNDVVANDGIFTATVSLKSTSRKLVYYYSKIQNLKSNKYAINFYQPFTSAEYQQLDDFNDGLNRIIAKRTKTDNDEENLRLAKEAYNEIIDYINQQKSSGVVSNYTINSSGISIVLSNGLFNMVLFETILAESLNTSKKSARIRSQAEFIDNENKIATRDYFNESNTDEAANAIAQLGNYSYTSNVDSSSFGLSSLMNLDQFKVIIIRSHGGNGSWGTGNYNGYVMQTCEQSSDTIRNQYQEDMNVRIIENGGTYLVTREFFNKYYDAGDFDNSFVFCGTCHSYDDTDLASIFYSKGVAAFIGAKNSINHDYNNKMCKTICEQLAVENEATNQLNTINQSLGFAKRKHGNTDTGWFINFLEWSHLIDAKEDAELFVYGDSGFRLNSNYLSGLVKSAKEGGTLSNAWVTYRKPGAASYTSVRVRSTGYYSTQCNETVCDIEFTANNFKPLKLYGVDINPSGTTYLGTTLLIPNDETSGVIAGKITNSIDAKAVSGAVIKFRRDHGVKEGDYIVDSGGRTIEIITDANGRFNTNLLPAGYYTAEIEKNGFIKEYFNVYSYSNSEEQNTTITPELPEGQYRMVLTWGQNPKDLDSHLVGTTSSGGSFHVYYPSSNMEAYDGDTLVANLDIDDTSSYGPETITLTPTTTGTYKYYVHRFAGTGSISTSGAQVKLYKGNTLIGIYNAPTDQGTGDYWTVFEITNGTVKNVNRIASSVQ